MADLGKILIIDDNEDVLFALNFLLKTHCEKVKALRSPERIVHFLTDFRPDIILLYPPAPLPRLHHHPSTCSNWSNRLWKRPCS